MLIFLLVRTEIRLKMEQNQLNQTKCSHCGLIFTSKGKYQSHYIQKHKNQVKTTNYNLFDRNENGKFLCICKKEFKLGQSLQRHQKSCQIFQNELENQELVPESEESHQGKHFSIIN